MAGQPSRKRAGGARAKPKASSSRAAERVPASTRSSDFPVVGIGASAGGLEALTAILENLPTDTGMSFVFVSHLDPTHESILTSLLARMTSMTVVEATHGVRIEPDHVYVIPRNARMTVDKRVLSLTRRLRAPIENLPIDHFMQSLARDAGTRAIGVILSGTASDGTIGLKAIKNGGGVTIVQEPASAKYDGMPRSAIKAKVVDFVLPPNEIAHTLARLSRVTGSMAGAAAKVRTPPQAGMAGIFDLLRQRTGADFSTYKTATIERRVQRRMVLKRIRKISDYVGLLSREPAEVDALQEDLLIKVTGFFRDPKTFEKLKASILPALLKKKPPKEPLRVWVPGCATGEEAYSIAMVLLEVTSRLRLQNPIQVFGTDLSEAAVAVARKGIYPANQMESVSASRRRRFFTETGREFRIIKQVRDACVFARQDMTIDPPFSRMDVVSCRNVLIYMGKALHDTTISIFHYALRPEGCLLLGKAESLEMYADLFAPVDRQHRIYRKRAAAAPLLQRFGTRAPGPAPLPPTWPRPAPNTQVQTEKSVREEAKRVIVERFAPSGVVIDEKMEIVEILGDTHPYVRLTPGSANLSLLRLVRPDLATHLSAAIDMARRTAAPVRRRGQPAGRGHKGSQRPDLEIIPLKAGRGQGHHLLVLFESPSDTAGAPEAGKVDKRRAARLDTELAESQEHVRLLMDVRQSAEEDLRSANEELTSSMEELQSANEELQTSREELESTNEELTTVNEQLAVRNRDLTEIGNDLTNLVTSVKVPIVILTGELKVRRSTAAADKVMGLVPADIGRHISEIRHTLRFAGLADAAAEVLKTLETREIEVQDRQDIWYSMRLRPYRTEDNRIDGLVVVLLEINRIKLSLEEVERARNLSRTIVEAVQDPLLVLNEHRRVQMVNRAFGKAFRVAPAAIENQLVQDLKPGAFASPALKNLIDETIAGRAAGKISEIAFKMGHAPTLIMAIDSRQFEMSDGAGKIILLTMRDITKFRRTERILLAARDVTMKGRRRAESSLRESKDDLRASRAELRVLAGSLINGQEKERARVARELHDDLSQRLAALQLESADLARLASKASPVATRYEVHFDHIAEIAEEVGRLAHDLHPSMLGHLGLWAALKSFCVEFAGRERIDVEFQGQKEPDNLPEVVALCLYRVTQEAMRNVVRHSGATSVRVSLKNAEGGLLLTIQDNGKGFDVRAQARKGLGLLSMNERLRLVDGTWQLKSRRGHGTTITAWVPVQSPTKARRSARRKSRTRSKRVKSDGGALETASDPRIADRRIKGSPPHALPQI